MKRPISIYLVAAWLFLSVAIQQNGILKICKTYGYPEVLASMVGLIGIVACIMLILLNIKAIWFAIIYFCTVTIGGAVNFTFFLRNHEFAPNPKIVTILLLIPIFNILCIWYLARPYFRKYAKEFIEERAKEKHYRKQSKNIKR